jgi:DNA-binding NarL/FixJ family response regulator
VEQVSALGAAGYLLKQTSAHVLARAVREVEKGNTFFSPSVARRLGDASKRSIDPVQRLRKRSRLTSREMEVLQLIAEGQANKQVAAELGISVKTVEKHRQHLMEKLKIHDTAGLTRHAIAAGVIESSVQVTTR